MKKPARAILILSLWTLRFLGGFFCPGPAVAGDQDQTILLEESRIIGAADASRERRSRISTERPALSTALPWEGEEEPRDPRFLEGLVDQLARSDSSLLLEPVRPSPGTPEANSNPEDKLGD